MTDIDRDALEKRVLVLAPTGRDAAMTCSLLGDVGIACETSADLKELTRELEVGAGAVILAEEALAEAKCRPLIQLLKRQPPWSDLPLIVLTFPGADSPAVRLAVELLGNVSLLERPVRLAALVSTVRTALRARFRQYQLRAHLFAREQAARALEEADRKKDEFVAMLAHELRNPLAPIRNSLNILRLSGNGDPGTQRVHEMMERQVNHMVRLVDDLLEVSRITTGKIELRKERVELAAVIDNAVETSQPLIDAFRHHLTIALPSEPIVLEGDPVRLAQVFANLLNNAAKYTDGSGQIWLTAKRDANTVAVSVRDSGVGIPSEMLPQVFNLFMQADRNSGRAHTGLGIGLTLVKSLVEMHGGSVEARSEGEGRGSEFIVRLPMAAGTTKEHPAFPGKAPSFVATRRILVVDDNRDAADSLGLLLKLLGAEVRVAYDGPEALKAIRAEPPAIVFLDIGMQGMDGYEVARRIREEPELRGVRLIALTGWGQLDDRRRAHSVGFDYHLTKPADARALQSLLVALDEKP